MIHGGKIMMPENWWELVGLVGFLWDRGMDTRKMQTETGVPEAVCERALHAALDLRREAQTKLLNELMQCQSR